MQGIRFDIDGATHEVLSAPVLDGEGDLVVMTVVIATGYVHTIKVNDITKLNRPQKPNLDS